MSQTPNNLPRNDQSRTPVTCAPSYLLVFEEDQSPSPSGNHQIVKAASIDEAIDMLRLLGDSCKPYISEHYRRQQPDLPEKIMIMASSEKTREAPFNIDRAIYLMKKLPFDLQGLIKSPIAISSADPCPRPIPKHLVHKEHESNVLVSEPFLTGWLRYFNIFFQTDELNFDHHSDHVQGMLILEALRQAGIASAHCQGLPRDGKLALLNYNINFFNFIEHESPVICRTYCSFTADELSEDKEACIYIQVFQWGRICADTVLKAFAYINAERCEKKVERLKIISDKQKTNFELRVKQIHEKIISSQ